MKKKIQITETLAAELPHTDRRKGRKPANAFEPGNPFAFRPGVSGNPDGKPASAERRLISKHVRTQLADRAPDKIVEKLQLPKGSSWAACAARSILVAGIIKRDVGALRLMVEVSEGLTSRVEIGAAVDEFGDPLPPPSLEIVFTKSAYPHTPHPLDRTPELLPPSD